MPLPPPTVDRQASHRRSISIQSYRRSDGLWDIEGHLSDVWPETVPCAGGTLPAHQPMHSMWLRYTVDTNGTIVAAQAVTDAGPYGPACGAITPDYAQLVGVKIGRGYRDTIRRLFGRTAGCTHMNELANAMGSAAMQALWEVMQLGGATQPVGIDGCHALAASGPQVARFFPQWYRPAARDPAKG